MDRRSTCHALGTETPGGVLRNLCAYTETCSELRGYLYIFDGILHGTCPSPPYTPYHSIHTHALDCIRPRTHLQGGTRHQVPQSTVRHDRILSSPRQHSTQGVACSRTDPWHTNLPASSQDLRVKSSSPWWPRRIRRCMA